jgi:hypothetical protein
VQRGWQGLVGRRIVGLVLILFIKKLFNWNYSCILKVEILKVFYMNFLKGEVVVHFEYEAVGPWVAACAGHLVIATWWLHGLSFIYLKQVKYFLLFWSIFKCLN